MKLRNLDPGSPQSRRRVSLLAHAAKKGRLEVVQAAADDTEGTSSRVAVMYLYGTVGGWWRGFDAKGVLDQLKDLDDDVDELHVHIHSPGGDAYDGIAIFNALRNHKASITTIVDGVAASAASIIAMAGDRIVMGPGTQMMIHDCSTYTYGNAAQLREDADWIDKQSANLSTIYAFRAGGTAAEWRERMLAETWYHAQEAVDAGLATEVSDITEPDNVDDITPDEAYDDLDELFDLFTAAGIYQRAGREAAAHQPPAASADGSNNTATKETAMAFTPEQLTTMRQELGLAEDADEATIVAALSSALADNQPSATTPNVPEGMTLVESAVLDDLRAGAQAGRDALARQQAEARDRAIDQAIADGRTTPARREHWVAHWDADPQGTSEILASLPTGLVPTNELGTASTGSPTAQTEEDALYADVFGDEKKEA